MIFRRRKKQQNKQKKDLKQGLQRTHNNIFQGLLSSNKYANDTLLETLETKLLMADVGVEVTKQIIDELTKKIRKIKLVDSDVLLEHLQHQLEDILIPCEQPLTIDSNKKPYVILMVGVNGAGKTTTIGKLVKRLQTEGKKVMLAAGDTFRAAAIEQLQIWGDRNDVPVIAQQQGSDTASVIYDAMQSAQAKKIDVLIADTAGRLHTQGNLMEELKKVKRVLQKLDINAPHEVMLVLDAGIGQNAIMQAKQFNLAIGITGITLTKMDGTAKGGIIFAIAKNMKKPIRFIGIGEGIDNLHPFNSKEFVSALIYEV